MTTTLSHLHRNLARLKRRRRSYRWATGFSALLTAVLLVLAVAFPIDWYFQQSMDLGQRVFLMVLGAAAVIWAFIRYTRPWLGTRESELDLALLVQRHEKIDSDLVAALEFEWPEAKSWGSVQLEDAVISQVAVKEKQFHVMENLPSRELRGRLKVLAACVALWIAIVCLAPQYVAIFFNRLLLAAQHYPTRVAIETILVNGREMKRADWGQKTVRVPYGKAIRLEIRASGDLPDAGRAALASAVSGRHFDLPLAALAEQEGAFRGELPRLVEPLRCQFFLGDAWSEPGDLVAAALPVVDLEAEVVPPPYAGSGADRTLKIPRGMRQFSVIENSQVRIKIRSDKPLKEAKITIDEKSYDLVRDEASAEKAEIWALRETATPLARIERMVRFSLQVTDEEEQQLEKPIEGVVRIQSDLPPRVVALTRTTKVLPTAMPKIYFIASDDHALARIWFEYEIIHEGKKKAADDDAAPVVAAVAAADTIKGEVPVYDLVPGQRSQQKIEDVKKFLMTPLRLVKGDTVQVTVWAKDYRGSVEGRATSTESPLVFEVTDEAGVLAATAEGDKESFRELNSMIQRMLDIGGSE